MIKLRNIKKKYGDHVALKDFSCDLQPGICGLLGHNGAGKSTLMKILCDQILRDDGEILVDEDKDILTLGEAYRASLGYVPQMQGIYENMTGYRFLMYIASLKKIPAQEARSEIGFLLDLFHLTRDKDRKLKTYSGGMKQRIMLSQAFLGKPKYLILDEPTVGLDPGEQQALCQYLREYNKEAVVLWSTHIVREIEAIADMIYIMKQGELVISGTVGEILKKTGTECLSDAYTFCMEGV